MHAILIRFLCSATATATVGLTLGVALVVLPRLGQAGRAFSEKLTRAPGLDVIVAGLTWVPWVVAFAWARWPGFAGALIGQMIGMGLWCLFHEMLFREAARGPRIVKFINRTVGRWQNHLALWVTLIALPGFWFIRFVEYTSYWPLVVLLGFPKYKQSEWINVSRHKFEGLIGHDLVWCLYCDWMTGVYSLGAEMLRNVESFWCPIRFYDGKKCENCRIDFPDLEHEWVPANGNMTDVQNVLEKQYGNGKPHSWFGHPARLTVNGQPLEAQPVTTPQ